MSSRNHHHQVSHGTRGSSSTSYRPNLNGYTSGSSGAGITTRNGRSRRGCFPLSLILIIVWIGYIAGLLYLLETAVKKGATSPPESLAWSYTTAPGILLTAFAQVHVTITSMHLARIALSALDASWTSPNQWGEFFWTASKRWASPLGIVKCIKDAIARPIHPSFMFYMFTITILVAIATPIILSHGFPISNVALPGVPTTIRPTTFDNTSMTLFGAFLQQSVGMGSWATGLPMAKLHRSSVFLPENVLQSHASAGQDDPSDFFFAGAIGNVSATLPGIRFQGNCTPVPEDPSSVGSSVQDALFPLCTSMFGSQIGVRASTGVRGISSLTLDYALCSKLGASGLRAEPTDNEGYFMYSYNTTMGTSPSGRGIVHCTSTFMTGTAELDGGKGTFGEFTVQELFDANSSSHGSEPLSDPMGAAWNYLSALGSGTAGPESVIRGLGFSVIPGPAATERQWTSPSPDDIAHQLWTALAHNAASVGFLSWSNATEYPASTMVFAAVYVHRAPYVHLAHILLGVWLSLIVGLTAVGWRKTFASSLDAYTAAEVAAMSYSALFVGGDENTTMALGSFDNNSNVLRNFCMPDH